MLPRAKWLVLSGPIGHSGTPLGTEMGRDAPETDLLHPTQQSWLPRGAWDFRRTLRVDCYDFLQKNSGAGAIWLWRCIWAETRWGSAFFRLHTGPGGLSCAATPPRHRVLADSEHRQRMSRAGSNGLDGGLQVLDIGLNRYRPSTRHYVYSPIKDRPLD